MQLNEMVLKMEMVVNPEMELKMVVGLIMELEMVVAYIVEEQAKVEEGEGWRITIIGR